MRAPSTHYFTLEGGVSAARTLNDDTTSPYVVLRVPDDRAPRDAGCWRVVAFTDWGHASEAGWPRFLCAGGTVRCLSA